MRIVEVLEHNGELYREGDFVRVTYDDGCSDEGIGIIHLLPLIIAVPKI